MDTLVSDNFDTIGTADIFDRTPVASTIGAKWRRQSGRLFDGDGSGRVKSGNDGSQASIDTGASDLDITVDVTFVGSVSRFSIGARANSTFNPTDQSAYSVWNTDASNIRLSWFNSTDVRTDYAAVSAGLTFVADTVYTLRLLISGTSIKFYINGVERISQTDANVPSRPHATIGGLGIGGNYADTRYDNFVVSSVGGAPADTENPGLTGALTVSNKTSTTITVSGPTATDNVGVDHYEFSRDGGATWPYSAASPTNFQYTGLTELTSYGLQMRAKDAAGNASPALSLTTSTYRAGALASTVLLLTGPQDGNPAGFLYAFAGTVSAGDWLSYTIVSGPTPAGGSLDANAMGAFSYTGPAPATMVIQPEVNGANAPETITVTLYDNSVSLGAAPMASTPTYGGGSVSQAAPVPLTGTAVAVASAYGSGQIAQGAPVVLAGAAFAVIPAMGNGAVSQGAPVALSGAALAVVPAMGAGGLVQGVPVALSAASFVVTPVFSAGALSQAAPVALMGTALSVSTAYGPGVISDAPTFTSLAPSPVCATYRRDSYPAHTFQKLAGETLDFDIDFRYELRSTQDSARIHDPVEIQAGQGVEVLGAYWVPGLRRVKLWITGGEAQGKSDISIWLNTAAGRRLQVDVRVQIK